MSTFDKLMTKLQADGVSPEEMGVIVAEVMQAAMLKLFTQMRVNLTEAEKRQIDETKDQEEMGRLFDQFYQAHFNQTVAEAIEELREQFAQGFLEKYQQEQGSQSSPAPQDKS